jgi:hypothetical protein
VLRSLESDVQPIRGAGAIRNRDHFMDPAWAKQAETKRLARKPSVLDMQVNKDIGSSSSGGLRYVTTAILDVEEKTCSPSAARRRAVISGLVIGGEFKP